MPKKKTSTAERSRVPDLPHASRAKWHLMMALVALRAAHDQHEGTREQAKTLAAAGDVVERAWRALVVGAGKDRVALLEMAGRAGRRRKVAKADVMRHLLPALPTSVAAFRENFSVGQIGEREALRNLARLVFFVFGSGAHLDGARLRRRWGVASADDLLGSPVFTDDVETFASKLAEVIEAPGDELPREIAIAGYRVLGLRKPLEHEDVKERRNR